MLLRVPRCELEAAICNVDEKAESTNVTCDINAVARLAATIIEPRNGQMQTLKEESDRQFTHQTKEKHMRVSDNAKVNQEALCDLMVQSEELSKLKNQEMELKQCGEELATKSSRILYLENEVSHCRRAFVAHDECLALKIDDNVSLRSEIVEVNKGADRARQDIVDFIKEIKGKEKEIQSLKTQKWDFKTHYENLVASRGPHFTDNVNTEFLSKTSRSRSTSI